MRRQGGCNLEAVRDSISTWKKYQLRIGIAVLFFILFNDVSSTA
jgi:hypothetical protein